MFNDHATKGVFDYRISIHNESESEVNPTPHTGLKSFHLPSESEPRFSVNLDSDPIIE